MSMRTADLRRRRHVMMRLRQRVDPRRVKWPALCRAVEVSLKVLRDLGNGRSLAWISIYGRLVYVIWDPRSEEIVTVLYEDYRAVQAWLDAQQEVVDEAG